MTMPVGLKVEKKDARPKSGKTGGANMYQRQKGARQLTDKEKLLKVQTMREAENQNVKEIQKQIGKLERLLREEALADGHEADLDTMDAKERRLNAIAVQTVAQLPTTVLNLKFKKDGLTKSTLKRGIAERAIAKGVVGYVKRITTGPTLGEAWAPLELAHDQKHTFDGLKKWLTTQGFKVVVGAECAPGDIPPEYMKKFVLKH